MTDLPFFPILTRFYRLKMVDVERTKYSLKEKIYPSGYPNIPKPRPYLFSISYEKYDYFLFSNRSESKFDLLYYSLVLLAHLPLQKVWSQHFPVLRLHAAKIIFKKTLSHFFRFGCFSRCWTYFLVKNKFNFLMQNLILIRLAPV